MLFILLCGCKTFLLIKLIKAPPFNGNDDYEILESVKRAHYKFEDEEWDNVSREAKELISKMLEKG
jgi:calcium-dependent protein kinase